MINKNNFSEIYSPTKVEEIVDHNKNVFYYKNVYRIIRHSNMIELTINDFMPTIMERNDFSMPSYEKQNLKTNNEQFSMSCFDTKSHLECYIESITSLREDFYSKNWYIVKGFVSKEKGFADKVIESGPKIGHINYYLFDPISKNPIKDFKIIKEEEKGDKRL